MLENTFVGTFAAYGATMLKLTRDSLSHPTCEKAFFMCFEKQSESEEVSPHELCLEKIAFELRLGFENLEIYTLQAV